MRGPRIAVVAYHLRPGRVSHWLVGGYGVPETYVDAVRRSGGRSMVVLPGEDFPPSELLDGFDGLLLVGGGDVEPGRYGAEADREIYGVEPDRDALEIDLLHEAADRRLPTLAICRGMQVLNVAYGGTLIQHLPDHEGFLEHGIPSGVEDRSHRVKVAAGSRLAEATGAETLACSSHHHQGVDRVAEGLTPTGWSEDGLVEAVEAATGWIVGVQWHPEDTAADDPAQQALFDAFMGRAAAS